MNQLSQLALAMLILWVLLMSILIVLQMLMLILMVLQMLVNSHELCTEIYQLLEKHLPELVAGDIGELDPVRKGEVTA